ncbi:MAG: heavy-metal-associated domain-containing protein [Loktanella sp.]|nr:heavy-metal-associated domain-containing protein [Loktanella sp.]
MPRTDKTFHVPDMRCTHCTAAIIKRLRAADAGAVIASGITARQVTVTHTTRDAGTIFGVLTAAGDSENLR